MSFCVSFLKALLYNDLVTHTFKLAKVVHIKSYFNFPLDFLEKTILASLNERPNFYGLFLLIVGNENK